MSDERKSTGLSLHPLSLKEAVAALLEVEPEPKRKRRESPPKSLKSDRSGGGESNPK